MKKDTLHISTFLPTSRIHDGSKKERRPQRLTSRSDGELLGSGPVKERSISLEDELWLKRALHSRLPIF